MTDHEDFIIPGEVDSLDAVPENLRGAYAAGDDGKFRPRVGKTESGYAFEHVTGLRNSIEAARAEAREAKAQLKDLKDQSKRFEGLDPDEAREAVDKLRSGKVTDKEQMSQREAALRRQLEEKHQQQLAEIQEKAARYERDAQARLISSDGLAAIARHGGNADLLMPIIERSVKIVAGDDGQLRAVVCKEDGTPRISMRDGDTGDMTIEEWVGDILRTDPRYAGAFAQLARGGAGGDRLRAASDRPGEMPKNLGAAERIAWAREHRAKAKK